MTAVAGTDLSLESIETLFNQDLNGDGQIGAPPLPLLPPEPVVAVDVGAVSGMSRPASLWPLVESWLQAAANTRSESADARGPKAAAELFMREAGA